MAPVGTHELLHRHAAALVGAFDQPRTAHDTILDFERVGVNAMLDVEGLLGGLDARPDFHILGRSLGPAGGGIQPGKRGDARTAHEGAEPAQAAGVDDVHVIAAGGADDSLPVVGDVLAVLMVEHVRPRKARHRLPELVQLVELERADGMTPRCRFGAVVQRQAGIVARVMHGQLLAAGVDRVLLGPAANPAGGGP